MDIKKEVPLMDESLIISCDASIKKNPGGPASVGISIHLNGMHVETFARPTNAITNNQAEYDAVYEAICQLNRIHTMALKCKMIQIHSDSQLVVKQITGKYSCQDEALRKRKEAIVEKMEEIATKFLLPPVAIKWLPRNSTDGLKKANDAAQDMLDVLRH